MEEYIRILMGGLEMLGLMLIVLVHLYLIFAAPYYIFKGMRILWDKLMGEE